MTETPQDDPRKGRHRFIVNRGVDQDQWCAVDADDYFVDGNGAHFVMVTGGPEDDVVAFASHPVTIRRSENVPEGQE